MKITKKTATSLVALTLVSGIGLAGVNTIASAQGNPKHQDTLVEKIANKFNLNKSDVQKVFDDNRSENENRRETKEKSRLDQAVKDGKITKDQEDKIYHVLWNKLSQPIRLLLENPYVYQGFWDYQNQKISQQSWKEDFEQERKTVHKALKEKASVDILLIVFNRLYTLRNQIIHGGATCNSSVNRWQLQNACNILAALLPSFIFVMLENAQSLDLGKPFYPVVQVC